MALGGVASFVSTMGVGLAALPPNATGLFLATWFGGTAALTAAGTGGWKGVLQLAKRQHEKRDAEVTREVSAGELSPFLRDFKGGDPVLKAELGRRAKAWMDPSLRVPFRPSAREALTDLIKEAEQLDPEVHTEAEQLATVFAHAVDLAEMSNSEERERLVKTLLNRIGSFPAEDQPAIKDAVRTQLFEGKQPRLPMPTWMSKQLLEELAS